MYDFASQAIRRFFLAAPEEVAGVGQWDFVETQTLVSAGQTVTFSGLSGDKRYLIVGNLTNKVTPSTYMVIRPNGETTNQTSEGLDAAGVSLGGSSNMRVVRVEDGSGVDQFVHFAAQFIAVSGRMRSGWAHGNDDVGGRISTWFGFQSTTTTEVTSIDVHKLSGNMDAGATFHLYESDKV